MVFCGTTVVRIKLGIRNTNLYMIVIKSFRVIIINVGIEILIYRKL